MPRHGAIIEPKERFVTYASQMDVSDEVLWRGGERAAQRAFLAEAAAQARAAAAKVDPDCPVIVTIGPIRTLPDARPYCTRWGVHVRVEFQRYVYDDSKRMAEEWQKEQIRRARYRS